MRLWINSAVRVIEIVVVLVLATILAYTYRELHLLRKMPVALPNYEFETQGPPGHAERVQTRGTWIAQRGPPEPLQTTTIECRKPAMQCVESTALLIFIADKSVMESSQTTFEVESWDDKSIATKPVRGKCTERRLTIDLVEKRAILRVSASHDEGKCVAAAEKTLELVAGYRVKEKN